jgi:DNA polymerase-3 subunit delta'
LPVLGEFLMDLEDFAGNEHLKEQLLKIIEKNNFPHAIILQGEEGTGKSTVANIIARAAVCSSLKKSPCNKCSDCLKAKLKAHPDIIYPEIPTARSIGVETIRNIRGQAYILPNEAKFKIYILKSADKMTEQAQNAFLKLQEEPPLSVIFILTCNSADSLLLTLRSRCQIFSLKPVNKTQILEFLNKNYKEFSSNEIERAADLSRMNIGLAISVLKTKDIAQVFFLAESIAKALLASKEWDLLEAIAEASKERQLLVEVLSALKLIFRDAYLICYKKNVVCPSEVAELLSHQFDITALLELIGTLQKTKKYLDGNVGLNFLAMGLSANLKKVAFKEG